MSSPGSRSWSTPAGGRRSESSPPGRATRSNPTAWFARTRRARDPRASPPRSRSRRRAGSGRNRAPARALRGASNRGEGTRLDDPAAGGPGPRSSVRGNALPERPAVLEGRQSNARARGRPLPTRRAGSSRPAAGRECDPRSTPSAHTHRSMPPAAFVRESSPLTAVRCRSPTLRRARTLSFPRKSRARARRRRSWSALSRTPRAWALLPTIGPIMGSRARRTRAAATGGNPGERPPEQGHVRRSGFDAGPSGAGGYRVARNLLELAHVHRLSRNSTALRGELPTNERESSPWEETTPRGSC